MEPQVSDSTTLQTPKNLRNFFEPKAIAVVGASRRPGAVGYAILKNLVTGGYKGRLYPINPKCSELEGLTVYASIKDLPETPDLALLIIPSNSVNECLEECGQKGIPAAVIISAGFKEIGGDGVQLEKQVIETAKKHHIEILGPNCLGFVNTDPQYSVNGSFARAMPAKGNIAFVSQSGALCAAILDYARGQNIGFSKFVSLGNKADINELDMLRYLQEDPFTDVILMYLEDLADGASFIQIARQITGDIKKCKPIIAIKSGRTAQGAKAASSHTGSLIGSDEVYDAIFAQAGVLRVDTVSDMFNFAVAFANEPLPKGNRVAIVTNAGGPGIMATDACVRYGLEISPLDTGTVEDLRKVLPPTANFSNPVDVIGDAQHDRYEYALQSIVKDPNIDCCVVILTPQAMTDIEEIAKVIVKVDEETEKPLVACFMGIVDVSPGIKILEENNVPHYSFPEDGPRVLGVMHRYAKWITRPRTTVKSFPVKTAESSQLIRQLKPQSNYLTVDQSMKVMSHYGFPVLPCELVRSEEEAVLKSMSMGLPVVMKLISQQVIHKMDLGGVLLNRQNLAEVQEGYRSLMTVARKAELKVDGILIQSMAKKGREVILGMKRDARFGPVLMFGLGGIYVEALKDVTFRLAPIRELGARRMIESIRTYSILKGMRGEPPVDFDILVECLQRLSQLAIEQPDISEIDINPLIVYPKGQGAAVADARIILNV